MINNDKFVQDDKVVFAQSDWPLKDITWLWEDDYYDGPITGMIEYHKKKYYTSWFSDWTEDYTDAYGEPGQYHFRLYCVYKLTKERQAYQEDWHELQEFMYNLPSDMGHKFFNGRYRADYKPLDLESGRDGEVVGWFIE